MPLFAKKKQNKNLIYLVEDDALLGRSLMDSLKEVGFEVVLVTNGAKVLPLVNEKAPDLILLDLILPGLDGFEVLKRLKAKKKTEQIPVVVISNLEVLSDVKSAKALGAEEYFIKANSTMDEIVRFVTKRLG